MLFKRGCNKVEALLWGYAANQLSEAENATVQRHLNACKECREQMSAYRQTVEGVALLRVQPVPASRLNWQDVQRRLAPATPESAALLTPALFRRVAAGAAFGGVACLLLGGALMRRGGTGETEQPDSRRVAVSQNTRQNVSEFLKTFRRKSAVLVAALDKEKRESANAPTSAFVQRGAIRPRRRKAGIGRDSIRLSDHWRAARQKHFKLHRSSTLLARNGAEKETTVQIVSLSPDVLVADFHYERESEQPEYVLTTIVDSAPQPRDFVIDSMTMGSQNSGSNFYNIASNGNGKEIRGW